MISCTASAAWSRHVFSPCYTEHGQRCGVVLVSSYLHCRHVQEWLAGPTLYY
jgi:hypothetical protein